MKLAHSFSVEIAKKYNVNMALVLQHFVFWYQKIESDKIQYYKGAYWVRMKLDSLGNYFPYFTRQQIRGILQKLIDENLIKKDVFNTKKNDRTRWYTLTEKSKKMLQFPSVENNTQVSVENNTQVSVENSTPSVENNKCIYKEEDIIIKISSSNKGEEILKNESLVELIQMRYRLSKKEIVNKFYEYLLHCKSEKIIHTQENKMYGHFRNWLNSLDQNNLLSKEIRVGEKLDYYLKLFNAISRKSYQPTAEIKTEFEKQLANGYTSEQMEIAIKNLYSRSDENSFHKKTNYQHATPLFLLQKDNLNKYLNANFR